MEETPAFLVPPELAARSAAVWWRRAAVVGGAVAAVVALLFVAAGHGARVADRHAAQDAVATVTPRAQEAAPAGARTAAGLAFETIPVAPQNRPSPPAAAAAPKEGERHRRHRRRRATDENTTLPPSDHTDVGRADVSLPRFGQF